MWGGSFTAQESKAGISCTSLIQRASNCSLISDWHCRQSTHSPRLEKCCTAPCHRQGDAWQNKLNPSLPPLSTWTRLCSTSLDEIWIQPVRERYPQPSIRDLSVQTPLWRITFALSPAGKALVFLFPLPLLSCHDWNSRLSKATMIYWNQFYLVRALASRSCANAPSNPQSKIKSPKNIFKWGKKKQRGKGWKFAMLPETWKIRNREMSIFSPKVHICPFTGAKSGIDSLEIRTDRRTGHTVPWLGLQRTHPKHL